MVNGLPSVRSFHLLYNVIVVFSWWIKARCNIWICESSPMIFDGWAFSCKTFWYKPAKSISKMRLNFYLPFIRHDMIWKYRLAVHARRNQRDIGTMSRCFLRIYLVNHAKCPSASWLYELSSRWFKKLSAGPLWKGQSIRQTHKHVALLGI